jgi:hypothetical protein
MSKSNFEKRSTNIMTPNIDRIISLQISEAYFIKYFFTSFSINSSFIRLESLELDSLNIESVISILTNLILLPRLFSLTISFYGFVEKDYVIYQLIIRLPVLKFVKLLFGDSGGRLPFLLAISKHQQSNTIEHLVVDTLCSPARIFTVLSYTPQLRRLSADWIAFNENLPIEQLIIPLNLTHISLSHWYLSFDKFESFISIIGSQLESLRISIDDDTEWLYAHRWQQLILRYMPHVRTFNFDYMGSMIKDANGIISVGHYSINFLLHFGPNDNGSLHIYIAQYAN